MSDGYAQYQRNQLTTATPGKLLVMTYDAAIRFARAASEHMSAEMLYEQTTSIHKVQDIILNLISSLDANADPKLADNLVSIYNYMFDRLTHANIRHDEEALREVIRMLTELRDAWAEAEHMIRSGGASSPAAEALAA